MISLSTRVVKSGVTIMKCCSSLSYSAASVASSAPTVKSSLWMRRMIAWRPRSVTRARAAPSVEIASSIAPYASVRGSVFLTRPP